MTFLLSSPKDFALNDVPAQHHSQNTRLAMPQPSFQPNYPPQPPLATPPASSHSPSYATDHPPAALPKVGQTRCYWTLLSSDLQFIYLDPVLACHLEDQAELLVGKSLLSFVHPDEQKTAKQDLGKVLESKTLHGSVTRVRFSRLSRVRRELGYDGPQPPWTEPDKIAYDNEYMTVDIVINWAAEGLVLCFMHASVDLSPSDNDEQHKSDWSNWCATPLMSMEQIDLLFRRLLICIPQTGSMNRVFQILANQPDKTLLFSWPPDPPHSSEPSSRDFAKLVDTVNMGTGVQGANDAKTSCTRRYKAMHDIAIFGGQVESIFIPHGCIIFACHKVNPNPRAAVNPTAAMQQLAFASAGYSSQANSAFYEPTGPYTLPPLSTQDSYSTAYMTQQNQGNATSYSPQRWSQNLPSTMSNLRSNSYAPPTPQDQPSQWQQPPPPSAYLDTGAPSQAPFSRSLSPGYSYSPTAGSSAGTSPISDVVPPPRRRISPGSGSSREYGPGGRNTSNRPVGILKCSSCKATSSPEWRKGPSGKKELCNACGLRYARSRAKKEGQTQSQRRRKEKALVKRESATPPMSASTLYPAVRRNYGDGSFSASSTGSVSGSDIYPHSGQHVLDNMTPSPSPPAASNMNFVHYSPASDNRSLYNTSSSFYTGPSPLSNPPVSSHQTEPPQTPSSGHHHHITQLPPLGHISAYADRLQSPMVPPASPLSHSSLASTLPPPSYEREREREREYRDLPPTPLSAEPRYPKRSILSQQ